MFTDYYLPTLGGVQTSIKAQREALEEAGHTVTVLCPLHEPSNDPRIVRLPTDKRIKPDGYPFAFPPKRVQKAAKSALQRLKPDVVHVHSEMFAAFAGLLAARELGIPLVQTMHGRLDVYTKNVLPLPAITTTIYERLHHRYIGHYNTGISADSPYTKTLTARNMWRNMVSQANFVDQVIVPSAHFAKKLENQGVRMPITVVSNGLEESVLDQLKNADVRNRAPGEKLKIMWCGRVSPEKRPTVFIEAIRSMGRDVEVHMYGDGVAMPAVKKYIAQGGLEDRITVHGAVDQAEVFEAMRTSHVFVSSSYDFDNQPMVLLEAVATGLPVVYCDPDMAEVVPAAGSWQTIMPNAEGIAVVLSKIHDDTNAVHRMSQAMLKDRARATQSNFTEQLLAVYESALATR